MRSVIIFMIFCCTFDFFGQMSTADSLLQQKITNPTESIKDSLHFSSLYQKLKNFLDEGMNSEFKHNFLEYKINADRSKNLRRITDGDYLQGMYYSNISRFDSSYHHFYRSLIQYQYLSDSLNITKSLNSMAIIRINLGSYYEAMKLSSKALRFLPNSADQNQLKLSLFNNIGIASEELNQIDRAMNYYNKSLNLCSRPIEKLVILNNVGMTYQKLKKYELANRKFMEALIHTNEKDYPQYHWMVKDNLLFTQFLSGDMDVEIALYKVYERRLEIGNVMGQIVSLLHLAKIRLSKHDAEKAEYYAQKSLKLTIQISDDKNRLKALAFLADELKQTEFIEAYIKLNDSIVNVERTLDGKFAIIDYESEQRQNENIQLKLSNSSKELALSKLEKKNDLMIAVSLFLLILISVLIGYAKFKKRLNEKDRLIENLKVREEERSKLSQHLHDDIASDLLIGLQHGEKMNTEASSVRMENMLSIFERAYDKMRNISQEWTPIGFEKISFSRRLILLIREYSFGTGLLITQKGMNDVYWPKIKSEIKSEILSIIQEALINITKHASASEASLDFTMIKNKLEIRIKDNGRGMRGDMDNGVGLINIEKRIFGIGGNVEIINHSHNGVELIVNISV